MLKKHFEVKKIKNFRNNNNPLIHAISGLFVSIKKWFQKTPSVSYSPDNIPKNHERMRFYSKWKKTSVLVGICMIVIGIWFVYKSTQYTLQLLQNFSLREIVFMWGQDFKKDEHKCTNILIVGTGGMQHESPDLTDTILVASINDGNNVVSMLSIPRDLYIEHTKSRINEIYSDALIKYKNKLNKDELEAKNLAMNDLKKTVEELLGIEVQYYIKTDFNAFKELVDAVSGITVYVEKDIDDPLYPDEHTYGYSPFKLKKGLRHLNGETALKYVRSRKSTSDYDRSKRQRQVILAIKEAALKAEILTSPTLLKELYNAVRDNISTDFSLTEIISLAELASTFDSNNLISFGLHDDPLKAGGFLYTPPREQFNDAFVLLPYDTEWIKKFAHFVFTQRDIYLQKPHIIVLNGTQKTGLATDIYYYLQRFGLNVTDVSNTIDKEIFEKNTVYYPEKETQYMPVIEASLHNNWSFIPCLTNNQELYEDNKYCAEYKDTIVIIAGESFDKTLLKFSFK